MSTGDETRPLTAPLPPALRVVVRHHPASRARVHSSSSTPSSLPDRWPAPHPRLDWGTLGTLDFRAPDLDAFPALALAFRAMEEGGAAPAVLNAADEVAVAAFLDGQIGFTDIARLVEEAMDAHGGAPANTLDDLLAADSAARQHVRQSLTVSADAG